MEEERPVGIDSVNPVVIVSVEFIKEMVSPVHAIVQRGVGDTEVVLVVSQANGRQQTQYRFYGLFLTGYDKVVVHFKVFDDQAFMRGSRLGGRMEGNQSP